MPPSPHISKESVDAARTSETQIRDARPNGAAQAKAQEPPNPDLAREVFAFVIAGAFGGLDPPRRPLGPA